MIRGQALAKSCLAMTLAAILPGMVAQIRRPSKQGLLVAMAQSSLSFYLFSYQVWSGVLAGRYTHLTLNESGLAPLVYRNILGSRHRMFDVPAMQPVMWP